MAPEVAGKQCGSTLIMAVGVALAVGACRGLRQHCDEGIAGPATLGMLLNAGVIALFVLGFLAAGRD